eukprot:1158233-Pelagomonas_calceolata.AAC.5
MAARHVAMSVSGYIFFGSSLALSARVEEGGGGESTAHMHTLYVYVTTKEMEPAAAAAAAAAAVSPQAHMFTHFWAPLSFHKTSIYWKGLVLRLSAVANKLLRDVSDLEAAADSALAQHQVKCGEPDTALLSAALPAMLWRCSIRRCGVWISDGRSCWHPKAGNDHDGVAGFSACSPS